MYFDKEEFIKDGFRPDVLEVLLEIAMHEVQQYKSKEAKYLNNVLGNMLDECQ